MSLKVTVLKQRRVEDPKLPPSAKCLIKQGLRGHSHWVRGLNTWYSHSRWPPFLLNAMTFQSATETFITVSSMEPSCSSTSEIILGSSLFPPGLKVLSINPALVSMSGIYRSSKWPTLKFHLKFTKVCFRILIFKQRDQIIRTVFRLKKKTEQFCDERKKSP